MSRLLINSNCLICNRISQIKNNNNPYFVKELKSGYAVLADYQFYKGYTLFLAKSHVEELHELKNNREVYLQEMALVAEAVYIAFKPKKINYELLGNTDKHLHWHIIPRYANDPKPNSPIWIIDKKIRYAESVKPAAEELKRLIKNLANKIELLKVRSLF